MGPFPAPAAAGPDTDADSAVAFSASPAAPATTSFTSTPYPSPASDSKIPASNQRCRAVTSEIEFSAGHRGTAALWLPSTRPLWMERAARATSVRGAPIVKLLPPAALFPCLPFLSPSEIRSMSSCFEGARLPAASASEMAFAAVEQASAHFLLSSIAAGLGVFLSLGWRWGDRGGESFFSLFL